jgi:hypothetical protein
MDEDLTESFKGAEDGWVPGGNLLIWCGFVPLQCATDHPGEGSNAAWRKGWG